jgi:competence protein ComGC
VCEIQLFSGKGIAMNKNLIEYVLILAIVMILMFVFIGSSWTGKKVSYNQVETIQIA